MTELNIGEQAIVQKISATGAVKDRLIAMGLVKGCRFKLLRRAPLGDPLEIKLKGFLLSLRLAEAETIEVEPNHVQ